MEKGFLSSRLESRGESAGPPPTFAAQLFQARLARTLGLAAALRRPEGGVEVS